MAKIKREETIIRNGEVEHSIKTFNVKVTSESFYMTFIDYISPVYGIRNPTDRKVLDALNTMAEFNTGVVRLTPRDRQELCDSLGIALQTFTNSIKSLKALSLITGERGHYEINPKIFWKGTTDARAKLLKEQGLEISIKFRAE
jgi:hypothetical protein